MDRLFVTWRYRSFFGFWPRLSRPRRFSEKVQKAKLTWRTPLLTALADKVAAKRVVAERLGSACVTPNLFVGDQLPPRAERTWPTPYVIKVNHRSGGNIFVSSAEGHDWEQTERRIAYWLRRPHGHQLGEWAYRNVRPQVLIEPMLDDPDQLRDYKVFVFGGRARYVQIHAERLSGHKCCFYDLNWNKLPFTLKWPLDPTDYPRPDCLAELIAGAEELGRGLPFVRADFYVIEGRPRFGEVTFYPGSGLQHFKPDAMDFELGALWPDGLPADQVGT
ncbi:ATP-grasp fold amidoligase family protein [Devosia sp.]|uniref:ATP-grasp fold amidoligase family protein n=1 Tax=Devosia sp. TaxID=1871048 RepID=UPI003A9048FE